MSSKENKHDWMETGHLIYRISNRMRADADRHFSTLDLTLSQVRTLHFINRCGGEAAQKQIEQHMNVSHPTVTGIVARLEKSGFVVCRQDDSDKRNKLVTLTDKAVSVMSELEAGRSLKQEQLVKGMSETEIAEASRLLRKMLDNLDQ